MCTSCGTKQVQRTKKRTATVFYEITGKEPFDNQSYRILGPYDRDKDTWLYLTATKREYMTPKQLNKKGLNIPQLIKQYKQGSTIDIAHIQQLDSKQDMVNVLNKKIPVSVTHDTSIVKQVPQERASQIQSLVNQVETINQQVQSILTVCQELQRQQNSNYQDDCRDDYDGWDYDGWDKSRFPKTSETLVNQHLCDMIPALR